MAIFIASVSDKLIVLIFELRSVATSSNEIGIGLLIRVNTHAKLFIPPAHTQQSAFCHEGAISRSINTSAACSYEGLDNVNQVL